MMGGRKACVGWYEVGASLGKGGVRSLAMAGGFYRGTLALWTFSVSEVKEACRFLTDFAKIQKFREITRLGIN